MFENKRHMSVNFYSNWRVEEFKGKSGTLKIEKEKGNREKKTRRNRSCEKAKRILPQIIKNRWNIKHRNRKLIEDERNERGDLSSDISK